MSQFSYLQSRVRWTIASVISLTILLLIGLTAPAFSRVDTSQIAVFEQVWQTIQTQFFDPDFNGVDWAAARERYRPLIQQAQSPEETARLINQMLAELNTSHTRFYTANEPAYYQILGIFAPRDSDLQAQINRILPQGKIQYTDIGIVTRSIADKTFIAAVWDGSPAAKAGLLVGDQVLSVDAQPFHPIQSFAGKANQSVLIKIQRSADVNSQQDIAVTPKMFDATSMFLDAELASVQVIERSGQNIGYIHIWSYAGEQYQQALEEELLYGRLREADGFVLDLREGWGGAPLTVLNIYTGRGPSVLNVPRDGKRYTVNSTWKKPVVMLVNEGSRSAKEILAYGFQHYAIGPVVGTQTAGAVVAGRPFLMKDGSLLYVAVSDVYVDGTARLEGNGVIPDVVVPASIPYVQGADPQKDKAIDVTLELVQRQAAESPKS